MKHSSLTAANRADALLQIKSMGCVPVSLKEGTAIGNTKKSILLNLQTLLLAVGVIIIVIAVLFSLQLLSRNGYFNSNTSTVSKAMTSGVKRAKKTETLASDKLETTQRQPKVANTDKHLTSTNNTTLDQHAKISPSTLTEIPDEETPPPELPTGTEQLLGMIASTPLGIDPVPMPMPFGDDKDSNEDAKKAFDHTIVITEKDTVEDELHKETIAWAKVDLKNAIEKGSSAKAVLEDVYAYKKEISKFRDAETEKLYKLALTSTPEELQPALDTVNEKLKAEGALPIDMDELRSYAQ